MSQRLDVFYLTTDENQEREDFLFDNETGAISHGETEDMMTEVLRRKSSSSWKCTTSVTVENSHLHKTEMLSKIYLQKTLIVLKYF